MTPAQLKQIARIVDLHGGIAISVDRDAHSRAVSRVISIYFPLDDDDDLLSEIRKEYKIYRILDGHRQHSVSRIDAINLAVAIKPYTAWHKNQINVIIKYRNANTCRGGPLGLGAGIEQYREMLFKKLQKFNEATRKKRAEYFSKRRD